MHGVVDLDAVVALVHARRDQWEWLVLRRRCEGSVRFHCHVTDVPARRELDWLVDSRSRRRDYRSIDVLALTILVVALSSDRLRHRPDLADGSTLVYRSSRVVNQGVYPQIRWLKGLSSSTAAVSRFDLGTVHVQRLLDLD